MTCRKAHRWVKIAEHVFRCARWPRCVKMWIDGQVI